MTLFVERRHLLKWIGVSPLLWNAPAALAHDSLAADTSLALIERDLRRYIGLGAKASGGRGDIESGTWFETELAKAGFELERLTFEAPCFDVSKVSLEAAGHRAPLIPQAVVTPTSAAGVEGPLFRFDPGTSMDIPGASIVIVDLPRQGWSTVTSPLIIDALARCERAGAKGVVLLTNGPTGEAIALNAHEGHPVSNLPVACLAPRDAGPFLELAARGAGARLTIYGKSARREAFNVVGHRRVPGAKRTIIVSTPRSGWFTCAAERGPGVALWLDLVRWAGTVQLPVNLIFSAHSGHEYENLGLRRLLVRMPPPEDVSLWLSFGAGTATRAARIDAPSGAPVAARRVLTATDQTEAQAQAAFTGWEGFADPVIVKGGGGGGASEAGTAIAAGYASVIGFNGANPYHHVQGDTGENVDPALVHRLSLACRALIRRVAVT